MPIAFSFFVGPKCPMKEQGLPFTHQYIISVTEFDRLNSASIWIKCGCKFFADFPINRWIAAKKVKWVESISPSLGSRQAMWLAPAIIEWQRWCLAFKCPGNGHFCSSESQLLCKKSHHWRPPLFEAAQTSHAEKQHVGKPMHSANPCPCARWKLPHKQPR